jgi:hypothetical protein
MKELSDIDIRHFKLSSGEEVIALVTGDDENVVKLAQPMQMHSEINQQTQAYYFTDWQPMAKANTCSISKLHIVSFVECADNVKEKYIHMCLESEADPVQNNFGSYIDSDVDELDIEIDEHLDPQTDDNPTFH